MDHLKTYINWKKKKEEGEKKERQTGGARCVRCLYDA